MPGYLPSDIPELVDLTRKNFGPDAYTNLILTRNKLLLKPLWDNHAEFMTGSSIEFSVMKEGVDNTRSKGYMATDSIMDADINDKGNVPWRKWDTGYHIEKGILRENSSPEKIIDYLRQREVHCWTRFWDKVETWFWGSRAADDGTTPFPLKYYIVKDHTGTNSGDVATLKGDFNGGNYWSGTTTAGLSLANYKNYNKKYTTVSRGDMIAKLLYAIDECAFQAPVPHPDNGNVATPSWGIYTTRQVKHEARAQVELANDNLGFDFSTPMPTISGVPFVDVPALSEYDTEGPVFGINWNVTKFVFEPGTYGVSTFVENSPTQHDSSKYFYDYKGNIIARDRRSLFVLATGSTL